MKRPMTISFLPDNETLQAQLAQGGGK